MLSTGSRTSPKRIRDAQRSIHLVSAVVLVGYVYLSPASGSAPALAVQWVILPALVLSGVALWKWHRLRRLWRRWR